ncbi:hypothetical protein VTL71DRAFT_2231 [Oculimacula yallundae]|uniref:Uncharacterized protein n=1 Tax=Oculimacula yallundae TaxID=86028 RepID=A0ABR4C8T4_9HELO
MNYGNCPTAWAVRMSGLKRLYPHGEEYLTQAPCAGEKKRLVATLEAGPSADSPWTTTNINGHFNHGSDGDESMSLEATFLNPCVFSPISGDSRNLLSPTETTWTPATASSETTTAEFLNQDGEKEICFGMLVNGLVSAWKSFAIPTTSDAKVGTSILKPRFRANGVTILNPAAQEIGVLDNNTASAITTLKKAVSSVKFDVYACQGTKQAQSQYRSSGIPLEILVFGPRSSLDEIGSLLSQSSVFLQEPIDRPLSVPYINPHIFSWDEDEDGSSSSYLLKETSRSHMDFAEKIQAILTETMAPQLSFHIDQDARITTPLKPHQLVALKFMISREGLVETDGPTLWKAVRRNGRQVFRNQITKLTKISKPVECRGGILADEMGMGKSLSLIALIVYTLSSQSSYDDYKLDLRTQKKDTKSTPTLIIALKSIIQGWKQQINEHTRPGALKVHIYHGNGRKMSRDSLLDFDIILTTYETAASDITKTGLLAGISWIRIVLDEAHEIRNRSTRKFQELTKLRAVRKWCLTGTPVQNRLGDLFSLTQFLGFSPLDNHANARKHILEPLSRKDPEGLENLRLALQTISLRRTKDSCSSRRRIEATEQVILNMRERHHYSTTRADAKKAMCSTSGRSQGEILLRAINKLRQICSHGGAIIDDKADIQHTREYNGCDKCGQIIDYQSESRQVFHGVCGHNVCYECAIDENGSGDASLDNEPNNCSVCQEPVISRLNSSQQWSDRTLVDQDVEIAVASTVYASKIEKVVANLFNLEQASPPSGMSPIKSLVFSHWNRTLNCLEEALSSNGQRYARIDGSLSVEQRGAVIYQFNTTPEIRILLLSYGVGSVGLNLQAATHVHLMEPHWNPMVEAQAAARVDRLDQLKDIYIYRYIVKDSIEEQIRNTQRSKLQDAELSVSRMATGEDSSVDGNCSTKLRDLL